MKGQRDMGQCAGCGADYDSRTLGCKQCAQRHNWRRAWALEARGMEATGATSSRRTVTFGHARNGRQAA